MLLHADLFVASMTRSLAFYAGQLGLSVIEDRLVEGELARHVSGGDHDRLRMVILRPAALGSRLELIELLGAPRGEGAPAARAPHRGALTFLVRDLEARLAALRAAGYRPSQVFRVASAALGDSDLAFVDDPDGHAIELLQPVVRALPARAEAR